MRAWRSAAHTLLVQPLSALFLPHLSAPFLPHHQAPKSLLYTEAPPASVLPMAAPAASPSKVGTQLLLGIALASAAAGAAIAVLAVRARK